jgi:DNA polymerase-3 subunit alpha
VHLKLVSSSGVKTLRLDPGLRVTQSSALVADLKELLGPSCLA